MLRDFSGLLWDELPAGTARRTLAIAFQVLLPYGIQQLVQPVVAAARRCEEEEEPRWLLQAVAPRLAYVIEALQHLHRAAFLLRGRFLSLAHRVLSLHHVRHSGLPQPRANYAPLGVLILLRLALSAAAALRRRAVRRMIEDAEAASAAAAVTASGDASDTLPTASAAHLRWVHGRVRYAAPRRAPTMTPWPRLLLDMPARVAGGQTRVPALSAAHGPPRGAHPFVRVSGKS